MGPDKAHWRPTSVHSAPPLPLLQPAHGGTPPCAPASARGCTPRCSSARHGSRRSIAGRWWCRSRGRRRCRAQVAGAGARGLLLAPAELLLLQRQLLWRPLGRTCIEEAG